MLGQTLPVTFTTNRKQRQVADITKELCDFINKTGVPSDFASFLEQPISLVGKRLKHRFEDKTDSPESNYTWYYGTILDYRVSDKTHGIKYDEDDEIYYFDVTIDFFNGDLIIIS